MLRIPTHCTKCNVTKVSQVHTSPKLSPTSQSSTSQRSAGAGTTCSTSQRLELDSQPTSIYCRAVFLREVISRNYEIGALRKGDTSSQVYTIEFHREVWVSYFYQLYVMLDLNKFLVILIISSAVTFAEESKRYQVSSFIYLPLFMRRMK